MSIFFFFNDTATTEIYTLSLHDALPIFVGGLVVESNGHGHNSTTRAPVAILSKPGDLTIRTDAANSRSEEHTSELQSQSNLVCRLLLEKKKLTDLAVGHYARGVRASGMA